MDSDFENFDRTSIIIGLMAAALSGAIVGCVAGAIGATLAWTTWGGY